MIGLPSVLLSFLLPLSLVFKASAAETGTVIFDMDSVQHQPGEVTKDGKTVPVGTAEPVPGKFNQAVRFDFACAVGPLSAVSDLEITWSRASIASAN